MSYRFSFSGPNNEPFSCILTCVRCEADTKSGNQCKSRTCFGLPYCWRHLEQNLHLKIKPSSVPNAGKGLFAFSRQHGSNEVVFKRGQKIADYHGKKITHAELNRRYGDLTAPYALTNGKTRGVEDGACHRGVGNLPNHHSDNHNAELDVDRRRVLIVRAIENIKNGTEIFVDYGDKYIFDDGGVHKTTRNRRRR